MRSHVDGKGGEEMREGSEYRLEFPASFLTSLPPLPPFPVPGTGLGMEGEDRGEETDQKEEKKEEKKDKAETQKKLKQDSGRRELPRPRFSTDHPRSSSRRKDSPASASDEA